MKKEIIVCIILFSLTLSVNLASSEAILHKVIKVIDGDTVYVDFNDNGIAEKDEKVRVNGIDTFETKLNDGLNWQMKRYNLTQDEALGLGYYGKEFAKKELLNKSVKAEYTAEDKFDKNNRHLMSIYYNCSKNGKCKNYEQEVLKAGLATIYTKSNLANKLKQYENTNKIKQNAKRTHKLNLVVLNYKNGKYHKTTCEYAFLASQQELIKKNSKYIPSSCCFNIPKRKQHNYPHKDIKLNRDISLYFVDPTKNEFPKNECTSPNCKALLNIIQSANNTIDFALYGFNEQDDILDALIQAQYRGVKLHKAYFTPIIYLTVQL